MILSVSGFVLWGWFLVSAPCGQRKCLIWFQCSWTCWGLLCVLSCDLSLKMFHVHLERICILLLWDERLSIYQVNQFHLGHCSMLQSLLLFCLEDLSLLTMGCQNPLLYLCCCQYLYWSPPRFSLCILVLLWVHMFTVFTSSWWILPVSILKCPSGPFFMTFILKSVLYDMSIGTTAFFLTVHLLGIFFSNPSLSVCAGLFSQVGLS